METDLDKMIKMLGNQPNFRYTQIGVGGNYTILALDETKDGGRHIPLLYFDLDTKAFVRAGVRWYDP